MNSISVRKIQFQKYISLKLLFMQCSATGEILKLAIYNATYK